MAAFQVIQPTPLLKPYIRQYWFLRMDNAVQGCQRLVPFGCVALHIQRRENALSYLSGQSTVYNEIVYSGDINFISVVFQPIGATAFFNIPMNELNNRNIPTSELSDHDIVELEKRLTETTDNTACVRLIEQFLLKRIYNIEGLNYKRLNNIIQSIVCGQTDITTLAQDACLGYKQFKRIFAEHIGANPKEFLRIARFQRTLYKLQAQPNTSLTQLAFECNYHDKSHLIRELKEFTGYTPTQLSSVCDPYSAYHALFRSAFIDVK